MYPQSPGLNHSKRNNKASRVENGNSLKREFFAEVLLKVCDNRMEPVQIVLKVPRWQVKPQIK